MDGIHKTRELLHSKVLRLRSIEGMVSSIRFERLWDDSSIKQREEVQEYIKDENRAGLVTWMRHHPSLDVGELTFTRIKEVARQLRICNYSRMSKLELIRAIKETEDGSK